MFYQVGMCMCIHKHTRTFLYVHIYMYMHIHISTNICVYVCTHTWEDDSLIKSTCLESKKT